MRSLLMRAFTHILLLITICVCARSARDPKRTSCTQARPARLIVPLLYSCRSPFLCSYSHSVPLHSHLFVPVLVLAFIVHARYACTHNKSCCMAAFGTPLLCVSGCDPIDEGGSHDFLRFDRDTSPCTPSRNAYCGISLIESDSGFRTRWFCLGYPFLHHGAFTSAGSGHPGGGHGCEDR